MGNPNNSNAKDKDKVAVKKSKPSIKVVPFAEKPAARQEVNLASFGFTDQQLRELGEQISSCIIRNQAEVFGIDATKQIKPIVESKVSEAIETTILQRQERK